MEKWQQHPFRVGIISGLLGLPLGWTIQESVLRLVRHLPALVPAQIFVLFMVGALPGAVLGAGLFKALDAQRRGHRRAVKKSLIIYGGTVSALILAVFAVLATEDARHFSGQAFLFSVPVPPRLAFFLTPLLTHNFPFHCAMLMFCCGLLMRSRR